MKCLVSGLLIAGLALILTSGCAAHLPDTVKVERDIEYAQIGGQSLRLDIYSPKQVAGKLPVVVWMHGGADRLVPPDQSKFFYDALLKAGVEAQIEIIPSKGHGIIAPPPVAQEIYAFFDHHLKPAAGN